MKAWAIQKYGDNSNLQLMDLPMPSLGNNEVLVQIKAASINPVDFKIRNGDMKSVIRYKFPLILGNDCSGVITATGSQVRQFKIGDEIYTRPHKDRIGTLAEYVTVQEDAVAIKPKGISFEDAASLPLVGLTSWQALFEKAELKKGDRVFIPAGAGGVGSFAIQLAKHFGAYVATNASAKNVEFLKSLGADEVVDYKSQDFSKVLSNMDIVFDTMGDDTQSKAFSILKPGGTLISIVGPPTSDFAKEFGMGKVVQIACALMSFRANRRAKAVGAKYQFLLMRPDGKVLGKIAALVESGAIRPVVGKVFSFDKANEAMAHVEEGHSKGKTVVTVS